MRILIIGGAGEVGRYLTHDFSRRGHEVTVLDRVPKPSGIDEDFGSVYLQGNIIEGAAIRKAIQGKEVVIHLAWSFADDAQTIFGEDIKGHIHLLDAASSCGIQSFIYASSATVYGRAVSHPVTETHPCLISEARKPLYALGKYSAEELCLFYCKERKVPVTIFRFWWAFGESIGGRHLRDLIRKALDGQRLEMVRGAGGAFLMMGDLGKAIQCAIGNPTASGQTYNLGSFFLTWEEIGKMIVELTNSSTAVQPISSTEWHGPAFLNEIWDLSWKKAERELGFKPAASPEEMRSLLMKALQRTVDRVRREK